MVPPSNTPDDSIDALKKRLDRWGAPESTEKRSTFGAGLSRNAVPSWGVNLDSSTPTTMPTSSHGAMPLARKVLFASILFFIVTVAAGLFFAFSGRNIFSPENVEISATGPVSVKGGEELALQVLIANKNNFPIETADLTIEYPEGSRDPGDTKKELRRERDILGTIESGDVIEKTVRAIVFGEENSRQKVSFILEYRTPDSNAIFVAEKEYEVVISSSPVALGVTLPEEVLSGQEIALDIEVSAQSTAGVKNLLVSAQYPPGFIFKRSEPKTLRGTSVWQVSDLPPGEKTSIKVVGVIEGQDSEIKSFKVSAGLPGEKDPESITTVYGSLFKTLTIERPQVGVSLSLNGSDEPQLVVPGGEDVRGELVWTNNLADRIRDVEVKVVFKGAGFDKGSVTADNRGFYQSTVPDITWNKDSTPALEVLDPGEDGQLTFGFAGIPAFKNANLKNREIVLDLVISGTRLAEGKPPVRVETKLTKKVLLPAEVQLVTRSLSSIGPFKNTGPLPPAAEKTTTYTVVWSLAGAGSDVSDAVVETTLPGYVTWLGFTSPGSETITFNEATRKVSWNVGALKAGSGSASLSREGAFQVSITPSLAQVGSPLRLISDVTFLGTDVFVNRKVTAATAAVSTETETDPAYTAERGRVVK